MSGSLLLFLLLCVALSLTPIREVSTDLGSYLGFIYPYAITTTINQENQQTLHFTRIDKSAIINYPNGSLNKLEPGYQNLPEEFSQEIEKGSNVTIQSTVVIISGLFGTTTMTLNSHLAMFLIANNFTNQQHNFLGIFQRKNENTTKFPSLFLSPNVNTMTIAVQECWRQYIHVYLEESPQFFNLYIRKQITNSGYNVQAYKFIRKFFFFNEIQGIQLVKSSNKSELSVFLWDINSYCVFQLNKALDIKFRGCFLYLNHTVIQSVQAVEFDSVFIKTKINLETVGGEEIRLYRLVNLNSENILNISDSCTVELEDTTYSGTVNDMVVLCNWETCQFFNKKCEKVGQSLLPKSEDPKSLRINKIRLIRFNISESQYISQLVLEIPSRTVRIGICFSDQIQSEQTNKNGNLETICIKKPTVVPSTCSSLSCWQCSLSPYCYFIDGECQQHTSRPIKLFDTEDYTKQAVFLQKYSKYLYGQTSECPAAGIQCTISESNIVSIMKVTKEGESSAHYCSIFMPLNTEIRYRFHYHSQEHTFYATFCSNSLYDSPFGCEVRNSSQSRYFHMKGIKYVLFYFFHNESVAGLKDNNFKLEETFELVNIEEQEIYTATKLFTIVFGSFLFVTVFFIAYILLRNRLMARLALWGVITFVPSQVYPLSKIELKLKIRDLVRRGLLSEYRYEVKERGKDEGSREECSFCLQEFSSGDQIFEIYCRHKYHKFCLSDWIKKERNSQKCPICKRGFTDAELSRFRETSHSYGSSHNTNLNLT